MGKRAREKARVSKLASENVEERKNAGERGRDRQDDAQGQRDI